MNLEKVENMDTILGTSPSFLALEASFTFNGEILNLNGF